MSETLSSLAGDVLELLKTKLKTMTENMVRGNTLAVSQVYADNALLTDLKDFRIEGWDAIVRHWADLPAYKEWHLEVLETGGDLDNPYQRLYSSAQIDFKGKNYLDEGYCFVVWKKQANSDYQILVDIYYPLKFEAL